MKHIKREESLKELLKIIEKVCIKNDLRLGQLLKIVEWEEDEDLFVIENDRLIKLPKKLPGLK